MAHGLILKQELQNELRNQSGQPDFLFSEHTNVVGETITLQLGTDVVDLDFRNFQDVTSSDVDDDISFTKE